MNKQYENYTMNKFMENYKTAVNLTEDDVFDLEEKMCEKLNESLTEVTIGFRNEENQSRCYFKKSDSEYPLIARLVDFELKNGNVVYLLCENLYDDNSKYYVFEDYKIAKSYLDSLENSELPTIESIIEKFDKLTSYQFDIEAKEEYNNGGEWVSFNVYYDNNLIYDGAFSADLNEELAKEMLSLKEVMDNGINGYSIDSIKKTKGNQSWEKYYEVELKKDDFTSTQEVSLHYQSQGQPRNVLDIITDEIDWDEIEEEYSDYCEEYDLPKGTGCSLDALDSNQERVADQERVALLDKSQEKERK